MLQGSLGIEWMCRAVGVSRVGYYRHWAAKKPQEEETEVRSQIQQIVLDHRFRYGSRRVARQLRYQGVVVNRKRVARIMREDNLLAIRQRRFVTTTESDHSYRVYLNLARRIELSGINQLWVADLTYIRLRQEFVYLAVVLDAYSRRVIGWALDRNLQTKLTVTALQQAVGARRPPPGVVHHSDRGAQYACAEYTAILRQHAMLPSMSRPGCPYDNAACESFMKTLKLEQIYANQYRDIEDLRAQIQEFLERYYNRDRLHSALNYQSPESFEAALPPPQLASLAGTVEFY